VKNLSAFVFAALLSSPGAAFASIVNATFDWGGWNGTPFMHGSFVGQDLNHDGRLSLPEFSAFDFALNGTRYNVGDLWDTGDIVIATGTWLANGNAWPGRSNANSEAYFTWDNGDDSCSAYNGCRVAITSFHVSAVPLPATALLFASGLIGLGLAARRRTRRATPGT